MNNTEYSTFTVDMNGNYYDDYQDNSSISELNGTEWKPGSVEFETDTWNINWSYRKILNVSNEDDSMLKKGYSINFTLNTQALVTAGKLRADCKDLRIIWQNGSEYIELDRINATACNTTNTEIWFKIQKNVSANASDNNYYLYYDNPSAGSPPTNQSNIWHYFNDFETKVGFDAGSLNPTRNTSAAKTGTYGLRAVGNADYRQAIINNTNSSRDMIFETWLKSQGPGGSGDTSTSLSGIAVAHPHGGGTSGAGTSLGYQAIIDERDAGSLQIRKDYDHTNRIDSGNLNLDFGNWYYLRFIWTSGGQFIFTIYNSSMGYIGKLEGNDTYWASKYTDGEYGVGTYNNADWDDYRVRMYIPNKPSITLGSEEAADSLSGNFTSTAINTTKNITQIINITWTENNTDAKNNITVEISVDNGNTWYKANNSQGLAGFTANNSLVYRVIFVTEGNKTISLLDMNITWIEQAGLPDLIPTNLSFSDDNPDENENITVYATILNNGTIAADNATVQFYDGNCTNGTQINGNVTIPQLNASQNTTINTTWIATPVGPHNIYVCADPANTINESNETNNNLNKTLNVKAWQLYYGHVKGNITLEDNAGYREYAWNFTDNGIIYAAYLNSNFSFANLQALGINTTGQKSINDFASADINLNMTGFNDSVVVYFAIDNSTAKQNKTWTIYNRNIKYVPYINSTNTSNFQTGILWDTADDTDGHYSTADKEDLVFIANINNNAKGKYGTYDYELVIPRNLALYHGSADKVQFYTELK